ncbi:ubiquitin-conjugating enzyme/RWD-like protein, partial [Auriculariales sp. MPI-PUGE-AT-0066]
PNRTQVAKKRIAKELHELHRQPEELGFITLKPAESNLFEWVATLPGPEGSPYESGRFDIQLSLPHNYPFAPPKVAFKTKIYHMNIASTGAICVDILKTNWSPALSLLKVVLSISSLLTDPNPSDVLTKHSVPDIARQYKKSRKQHDQLARKFTRQYAVPNLKNVASQHQAAASTRPHPGSSPSTSRLLRASSVIEISDSDDEPIILPGPPANVIFGTRSRVRGRDDVDADTEGSSRHKRTRPNGQSQCHQHDVIVIDD